MSYMVRHMYLPALIDYSGDIAQGASAKADLGIRGRAERDLIERLTVGIDEIYALVAVLEEKNAAARQIEDVRVQDETYRDEVVPAMDALRAAVDAMEPLCSNDYWPVPGYNKLLFYS